MKQKIIGTYYMGQDQVQLVLREGLGGEFYLFPEKGHIPRIKIGAEYDNFECLVEVLLHESLEFVFTRHGCRFKGTQIQTNEHSQYLFVFDHTQFSEMIARSAEFVTASLSDIKKTWKKWNKKEHKK